MTTQFYLSIVPRKKINIITPHFAPENTAASHRMECTAKVLSASFEVNVFTLTEKGNKVVRSTELWSDNLTVHYLDLPNYPKNNFILRAFFEWWYSRKLVKFSNQVEADVVLFTTPFMFLINAVANYSTAKRKIADVRDLVWHYLPEKNYIQRKIKNKFSKDIHQALQNFDAITVTNSVEKKWLIDNAKIESTKIKLIPNGISEDKLRFLQTIRYSKPQKDFIISYIGNIGSAQAFLPLIDAIKNKAGIKLNLIGDGNRRSDIQKYLLEEDIRNVYMPGKLRWARIIPYYQSSSILFASLQPEYNTAVPSKMYEYLATGLPIIFLGKGATVELLNNFDNVFHTQDYSSAAIGNEIAEIRFQKPANSLTNTITVGENFTREKLSIRFVELIAGMLNEKIPGNVFVEDVLSEK